MHMATSGHSKPERRIAKHLIIYLVLASAFVTLLTTAFQLYRDYTYDIDQINDRFSQIERVYLQPLSHALWATDKKEVELQITGMVHLPDMQYISVYTEGRILASAGRPSSKNIVSRSYPLTYTYRGIVRNIGRLEIVASLDGIYNRLFGKIWVILISNAIKTLIIAGFFIYIFQRMVTRHINHLADQVRMMDADDLHKPLRLERSTNRNNQGDEFDVLIKAFDTMRTGIAEAIDEIKQREAELKIYETILATTTDQMSYVDRNYVYQAVNPAYMKNHNKQRNEIIGHSVQELLGEELFESVAKPNLDRAFEGRHVQALVSVQDEAGKPRQFEINYYPFYGDSDKVFGAVVNSRDVTERVNAEQERMRHAQVYATLAQQGAIEYRKFLMMCLNMLQDVFHASHVLVGKLMQDGKSIQTECVLQGDALLENFTYKLSGSPCEQVLDNNKAFYYQDVSKLFPLDILLADIKAQTYFGVSLVDTRGVTTGILVVIDTKPHVREDWHDYTMEVFAARISVEMERADALFKLESYNELLESQVAERTRDLKNSIKEIETFSYTVSHDLRAPLRAMNGYSQILIDEYSDAVGSEGAAYLSKIKAGSEKMSMLIDSLLQLSRISRQNMEMEYIDLSEMCENILMTHFESSSISRLRFYIQPDILAYCDEKLMRIALVNLIDNAIKYSSKNPSPEITVGLEYENGEQVFYIKDNGVGFDSKYADVIFKPFQRLHTDEFIGNGIGLATVQRIINRHGGSIWADSSPNSGAVFYFTLPDIQFQKSKRQSSAT